MLRDLGSSNGTFVNGKRVLGQQSLKAGDVLTIGGVTLRVDPIKLATKPDAQPAPESKPTDTAELDALPVAEDDLELEEFEIAIDDEPEHIDIIPLDDEPAPAPPKKAAKPASPTPAPQPPPRSRRAQVRTRRSPSPTNLLRAHPKRKMRSPSSSWI